MDNAGLSYQLKPGMELMVKQRPVVLIEDLVNQQLPNVKGVLPLLYRDEEVVFCSLKSLHEIRKQFSHLPVYGLWQLIFSSKVDLSKDLYVVYFDESHKTGSFLARQDGGFVSGNVARGQVVDVMADIDLNAAEVIELKPSEMRLPANPVLTPFEGEQIRRRNQHKIAGLGIAAMLFAGISFAAVSYVMNKQQVQIVEKEEALLSEIGKFKEQRDALMDKRIRQWPNQWPVFYPLVRLWHEGVRFSVWGFSLDQPVLRTELLPNSNIEPMQIPEWMYSLPDLQVKHQIDGSAQVSWANVVGSSK